MSVTEDETFIQDVASGDGWTLYLDDSCERLGKLADESVDLSVYSPPFADLYVYSDSVRDLGNCRSPEEFFEHYDFVVRELLRVTKPGRLCAVHVADLPLTKARHGYIGTYDFPGDVIRAHEAAGWIYNRRWTINKNPQYQAQRAKAHQLMFVTLRSDSSRTAPALPDYLLLFRKPGDNTTPISTDVTNDEWIEWAAPVARLTDEVTELAIAPAWLDIEETNTLNAAVAREEADGRHTCPLQLDLIERCVRLWSNRGEVVLSPFAGIGSEGYVSLLQGRRFVGCELKPSYWRTAVDNLRAAERRASMPSLFDDLELTGESA
ncbi:hypothetical protein Aph01nite_43370 [Acrocarpospora phusangensis]|uniref:Methyltransferase n=1 Tax=Acrocarpospora phusangensis TaxID=1070424 RepID=A0A919UPS4_9ACTN|nr:site-specific DNA-methyltransferase [Acrocarpospora phusangensis]GIH26027.1 hypothetical protein Aph01nite_43370 [Acrocarpospora phusangensis]